MFFTELPLWGDVESAGEYLSLVLCVEYVLAIEEFHNT